MDIHDERNHTINYYTYSCTFRSYTLGKKIAPIKELSLSYISTS